MGVKELVTDYYKAEAFRNPEAMEKFIHNELVLQWHSSKGYLQLEKSDLITLAAELNKSYCASRVEISHMVCEGDTVSVRYTHYVNTFENPSEEMILAHFVIIWEVKDGQLYKGFLMSQLG